MDECKKINVAASSSIFDLKAELHKKKEALKQEKLEREYGIPAKVKHKKLSLWQKHNSGVHERAKKDVEETKITVDELERSRAALEKKAKLYDTLSKGDVIPDDEENDLYLVNFQKKVVDTILHSKNEETCKKTAVEEKGDNEEFFAQCESEEWVDYTDSLGRSRCCLKKDLPELLEMDKKLRSSHNSATTKEMTTDTGLPYLLSEDMKRELQRKQWEKEEEEARNRPVGPIHYQNVQFNEIRNHGIGYFAFSTTEEERVKQMATLNDMREQTNKQREIRNRLKEKRKLMLEERLAKVRQRKNIKLDEETGQSIRDNEEYNHLECSESEVKNLDPILEVRKSPEPPKIRPWDIGKNMNEAVNINQITKPKYSESAWIAQRREERLEEFAPPAIYHESKVNSKIKEPCTEQTWDNCSLDLSTRKSYTEHLCDLGNKTNISSIPLPEQNENGIMPDDITKVQQTFSVQQNQKDVERVISEALAYFRAQSNSSLEKI